MRTVCERQNVTGQSIVSSIILNCFLLYDIWALGGDFSCFKEGFRIARLRLAFCSFVWFSRIYTSSSRGYVPVLFFVKLVLQKYIV